MSPLLRHAPHQSAAIGVFECKIPVLLQQDYHPKGNAWGSVYADRLINVQFVIMGWELRARGPR